ncbi:hypothetical protein Cylst_5999 [Cylindrospermum stagnale PCC 7417]|uniref:Uncharacterized protein n=1 Tax=Cylindrospermum stagnale PCC 7417 TaxID=56107 RepID=K9X8I8_9NOST|nr:hypothetical protein [Cylindrospermum stagnale]AFZ27972.1 hypothetical protein Cylst_5999 [Cylindrospermum stagnale PCC 7417]
MNQTQNFSLQFLEPCFKNWFLPPEDPLGELSHLEMGLKRLCFENNYKILLEIGCEEQELFLDPDIILVLDELPEKVSLLLSGKNIELEFPESSMVIYLQPIDFWQIKCIWKKYGYSLEQKTFLLDNQQVLNKLLDFLARLINMAVNKGYISFEEGSEFIIPISRSYSVKTPPSRHIQRPPLKEGWGN